MGADVGEPRLDLGAAEAVGRLGLGEERRALLVGGEHDVDQGSGPARRLLRRLRRCACRAAGDTPPPSGDDLAVDDAEERRLAGAVAADEPDLAPGRQREGRMVEEKAVADAVSEVVDVQHGRLLTREGEYCKGANGAPADGGVEPEK